MLGETPSPLSGGLSVGIVTFPNSENLGKGFCPPPKPAGSLQKGEGCSQGLVLRADLALVPQAPKEVQRCPK